MKSLKRTLSLVLALVMVLGLFGGLSMTASATGFSDDDKIQYKEAVDVMAAIGAVDGYGSSGANAFKPDQTITRAEAAKLVAFTILGEDAAKKLAGVTTKFTDVPADKYKWAIPSIEYLTQNGIINGMGDGTFKPEDPVTGYEIGKMLLCALGYGAKKEFVGDGWKLNVAVYGNKLGDAKVGSTPTTIGRIAVFSGRADNASGLDDAATREEVALYCFNAIQKEKVEYISTLDIYSTTSNTLGLDLGSIASNVYPSLECDTYDQTGVDDMGNPANVWTYKNKEVGAYAVEANLTFTTAQTPAALDKALKGYKHSGTVDPSENNKPHGALTTGISNVKTYLQSACGNGVVVKVYADDDKDIEAITVVSYDLTKVSAINTAAKSVTLTTADADALAAKYTITEEDYPELYAKVSGLKTGDYVIVTPVWDGVSAYVAGSVDIPTELTGKIARVNATSKAMTFEDGKTYQTAKNNDFSDTATPDIGNDVTVLLDTMGNVVHWKAAETPTATVTYGFTLDVYSTLTDGRIVNMAKVVLADGEIKDIPAGQNGALTTALDVGKLYKLEDKTATSGVWDGTEVGEAVGTSPLAAAATKANDKAVAGPVALAVYDNTTAKAGKINATDKTLTVNNNNKSATANNGFFYDNFYDPEVKFVFISNSEADGSGTWSASVETGVTACDLKPAAAGTFSYAIIGKASASDPTLVVKAVFVNQGERKASTDPSSVLFIADASKYNTVSTLDNDGNKKTVYNYEAAYINGELVEGGITVANKNTLLTAGFYSFAKSSTIADAYDVDALSSGFAYHSSANVLGIDKVNENHAPYFKITGGTGAPATDGLVNLSSAKIVDVRSTANQATVPVTTTPAGLQAALKNSNLTVGVLYDATKGYLASVVYICGVSAPDPLTLTDIAPATDVHGGAVWSDKAPNKGDTVTLTLTGDAALQNGLKLVTSTGKIIGCSLGAKCTIAADGLSAVIADEADAQGVEITYTIWLTGVAPTITITDAAS